MLLSSYIFINEKGVLVYLSNGKCYEIVGGSNGVLNLRPL